jgi:hypothetical protein
VTSVFVALGKNAAVQQMGKKRAIRARRRNFRKVFLKKVAKTEGYQEF